jgi:curved DNA-binding protein CbpA
MKDYYSILGIIKTAEDIVVKAAYRALAQKYHPDKFSGDPAVAQQRMQEINEAYSVLSDEEKRREYDKTYEFQSSDTDTDTSAEHFDSDLDQVWNEVSEYYPDLINIEKSLSKVSKQLVHTFKYSLIESKQFEQRKEIANQIETRYWQSLFGTNKEIIEFGKILILCKYKNAAKKLNRAVSILGSQTNPEVVIDKIKSTELGKNERIALKLIASRKNTYVKNNALNILNGMPDLRKMDFFIKNLGGNIKRHEDIFKKYQVEINSSLATQIMSLEDLHEFCKVLANIIVEYQEY